MMSLRHYCLSVQTHRLTAQAPVKEVCPGTVPWVACRKLATTGHRPNKDQWWRSEPAQEANIVGTAHNLKRAMRHGTPGQTKDKKGES